MSIEHRGPVNVSKIILFRQFQLPRLPVPSRAYPLRAVNVLFLLERRRREEVPVVSGTGRRDVTGLLQLLQYLKTTAAVKRWTQTQAIRLLLLLLLLLLPAPLLLVVVPSLMLPM